MSLPLQYLTHCGYKACTLPEKKIKVGIFLPEPLAQALDAIVKERVNSKQKWAVASAAVLALLELPRAEQNEYIRRLLNADAPDQSFGGLVVQAQALREGKELERKRRTVRRKTNPIGSSQPTR